MERKKKINRLLFVFFLLIFAAAAAPTEAKTIVVATNGVDGNPGTQAQPVRTPGYALDIAAPGDTIQFRAGRYQVSRTLWISKANLTLMSFPGEQAAIVAGTAETSSNPTAVLTIVANGVVVQDLEVEGGSYYGIKIDVDGAMNTTGIVLRRVRVHHTGRDAIKTFNADGLIIEDSEIAFTGVRADNAEGIDCIGSIGAIIRRNYIHDTRTTGIYIKGGARNCVIERNRVENCGNSGILLGQDTDPEFMRDGTRYEALDSVARNNIVVNTVGAGIGTYSGSNVRFENNTVINVAKTYHAGFYVVMNNSDVPSRQVSFKNNILVMSGTSRPMFFVISNITNHELDSDNNIFFRPDGGVYRFSREIWPDDGFYWTSLSAWQQGMGVDRNSTTVDPRVDASQLYMLLAGSPAIDAGVTLSGVSVDYHGVSRPQGSAFDIGAHEMTSGGSAPPPPPNQPPSVLASASVTSGVVPLAVNFSATASDPDGRVVSYRWDFGDGGSSTQSAPSHTYQSAGTYTARVTVTDDKGATASANVVITVSAPAGNQPPSVTVSATPVSGVAPLAVKFTATASDPDGQVVSYHWDFGDGGTSTQKEPSYTYSKAGSFTAKVTVTDDKGATASATVVINVTDGSGTTTQAVVWKNAVGVTVSDNNLTKTAPTAWGNAGASSTQMITSGNGYAEFTAVETNNERMFGLAKSDPDQHYNNIDYAIHLNTGRAFYVYEKGVNKGYKGDFNTGDVFRIAIVDGVVKYMRNGVVFHTSTVAPSYPLMVDTALLGTGATIKNVMISGSAGGTTPAPKPKPEPPVVRVISPNTAVTLRGNEIFTIEWSVEGTDIWRQDIEVSFDAGKTWESLAVMLPGSATSYSWTVPNIKTKKGRIRVTAYGADSMQGRDASDSNFSITKVNLKKKKKKAQ